MERIGLRDQGEIEELVQLTELELQELLTVPREKATQMQMDNDILSIPGDGAGGIIFETVAGPVYHFARKRKKSGEILLLSKKTHDGRLFKLQKSS